MTTLSASRFPAPLAACLIENQRLMSDAQRDMCIGSPILVWVIDDRRRSLTKAMRDRIYLRDGNVCAYCGATEGPFHIDHIFPLSRGGGNDPENLTVACHSCNSDKSDMTTQEWLEGCVDGV